MRRVRLIVGAAACLAFLACSLAPAAGQIQPQQKGREKTQPQDQVQRGGEQPTGLLNRANVFIMQGRCEDAIPILERLTAEYPQVAAASEMLADCYFKTARPQDAAILLERRLTQQPGDVSCIKDLGRAYIELGRKEEAVAAWGRLLGTDKKSAAMYSVVAKMEQEAGLYDEAIATLRRATVFEENADHLTREIIRLEMAVGREEDAFRDALLLAGRRQGAGEGELRSLLGIFRESRGQARLLAIVDSTAAAGVDENDTFRTLKAIFLIEGGRYDDARRHVFGGGVPPLREEGFYSLIVYMGRLTDRGEDPHFAALKSDMMQEFLKRFDASVFVPGVMLVAASSKREAARSVTGPAREKLLGEALELADAMRRHRLGAAYAEEMHIFRATVLFDDLHRPAEALRELAALRPRGGSKREDAEELRIRVLLASSDWNEVGTALKRIAGDADTTVAQLGRYGLGRLAFLTGRYEESVKALSDLAEKHPSSAWANDALELAMEVKGAMQEDGGALALYRGAVLSRSRGEYAAAIDTLAEIERRFPLSSLAPRAIFMRAEIEADSGVLGQGGFDAARADFTRLAESYPLHDLAPRALERLAGLVERESPVEALAQYGRLMERYPEYPFMERVRERYIALGKAAGAEAPKAKEGSN